MPIVRRLKNKSTRGLSFVSVRSSFANRWACPIDGRQSCAWRDQNDSLAVLVFFMKSIRLVSLKKEI